MGGEELCSVCLKELSRQEGVAADMEAEDPVVPEDPDLVSLEATSEMEEMEIDLDEEIPSNEFNEIDRELGLSEVEEEPEEVLEEDEETEA